MTRRPRCIRILIVVGALTVGLAACGIPLDDEPRPITRTTLPAEETPTTVAGTDSPQVAVYFLRDDALERHDYPVTGEPVLYDALTFALQPPAEGIGEGVSSSVPPGTELRGVVVDAGLATIGLNGGINAVSGLAQKQAFAQLVFTALAFDDVQQVRFVVDDKAIDAPTDDGNLPIISAGNYDPPLNPR